MQKSINPPASTSIVQLSSSVSYPVTECSATDIIRSLCSRADVTTHCVRDSCCHLPLSCHERTLLTAVSMSWSVLNLFLSGITESQNSPDWKEPQKTIKSNLLWKRSPDEIMQYPVQPHVENLHHTPGEGVPVMSCSHCKNFFLISKWNPICTRCPFASPCGSLWREGLCSL